MKSPHRLCATPSRRRRSAFDAASGTKGFGRRQVKEFASAEGRWRGGNTSSACPRDLAHTRARMVGQSVLELVGILCQSSWRPGVAGMEEDLDVPARHRWPNGTWLATSLDDERRPAPRDSMTVYFASEETLSLMRNAGSWTTCTAAAPQQRRSPCLGRSLRPCRYAGTCPFDETCRRRRHALGTPSCR